MKTHDDYLIEARAYCDAVNAALAATRGSAMAVDKRLQDAYDVWIKTGNKSKAMAALRDAWFASQADLQTLERAHEGALLYFVKIKNDIKASIEKQVWSLDFVGAETEQPQA